MNGSSQCDVLRCSSQRLLPIDSAIDGWTRIDFRRGDYGCKLHPPLRLPYRDNCCRAHRNDSSCDQHFALLRISRPTRSRDRKAWNDRNRKTFVVSAGLHRCPDHVERTQRLARYAASVDTPLLGVNRDRFDHGTGISIFRSHR